MYREGGKRAEAERPPAEFVYDDADRGRRRPPGVALLQAMSLPVGVAGILSMLVGPTAGLVGLVASGALGIWWWRRPPPPGVVLRVEGGALIVQRGADKWPGIRYPLVDLVDVALDTKTIQRVEDGGSAIPGMRFVDSRVGPDLDIARIVLVPRVGEPMALTDERGAHMNATEWLGKIRVFLRKNGWVPMDERASDEDADADGV